MTKKLRRSIVSLGVKALDKTVINIVIWLAFVSSVLTYFILDKQKLAVYVVSFAINQFLLFIVFGSGLLAVVNIYFVNKIPSIIDEILVNSKRDYWTATAPIYRVLQKWNESLLQQPLGFNSIGKELIVKDFLKAEINYIEYNLVVIMEYLLSDFADDRYATSEEICKQFKTILLTNRLNFHMRFDEAFTNKLTIDPAAKLPASRKKEILRQIPHVILQKYLNSSSNFNVFLDNCISQIIYEKMNRYNTLKALFSDLVKCVYSYKDNLIQNFREEFNGDLAQYHLLYNNCKLSPEDDYENGSKKDYSI